MTSSLSSAPPLSSIAKDYSLDQLEHVHQLLQNPLTGRSLMVPFTTKAFVRGRLQPTIITTPTTTDSSSDSTQQQQHPVEEEQLWLYNSNKEKKLLTRAEVSKLIQEAIDQRTPKQSKQPPPVPKQHHLSSSASSSQPIQATPTKIEKLNPKSVLKASKISNQHSSPSPSSINHLPMFDIREEYTDDGKQVHAEAINITKQLSVLQQQLVDGTGESKSHEETEFHPATTAMQEYTEDEEEESSSPPLPSDAEYQALSARLEQLAKLEEEAEQGGGGKARLLEKMQGTTSQVAVPKAAVGGVKKKSGSSGWNKGFLNKNTTKTEKTTASTKSAKQSTTVQESVKPPPSANDKQDASTAESRKVRFQDHVDPADAPLEYLPPRSLVSNKPAEVPKLLATDIFSGVVRERPVVPVTTSSLSSTTTTTPTTTTTISPTPTATAKATTEQPAKKKLSRFALQRQQQAGPR